jgi:hypothetical protein
MVDRQLAEGATRDDRHVQQISQVRKRLSRHRIRTGTTCLVDAADRAVTDFFTLKPSILVTLSSGAESLRYDGGITLGMPSCGIHVNGEIDGSNNMPTINTTYLCAGSTAKGKIASHPKYREHCGSIKDPYEGLTFSTSGLANMATSAGAIDRRRCRGADFRQEGSLPKWFRPDGQPCGQRGLVPLFGHSKT